MDHELREPLGELRQAGRACSGCRSRAGRRRRRRAPKASRIALVRGSRGRETAMNVAMNPSASRSESASWPPKLQCTFSKVQQKSVARKKKLVTRPATPRPAPDSPPPTASTVDEVGELLHARQTVDLPPPLGAQLEPARACRRSSGRAGRAAPARSRRCRRARRRRRRPSRGSARPRRRPAAPRRGSAGRRPGTRTPSRRGRRARGRSASGISSSSASESRWSSSARRCGAYGISSIRSAIPVGPLAVGGAEVADEPRHHAVDARERGQERLRVALAEERAGVRDPERVAARVLEPGEVLEVGAVRDRHDAAPRDRGRASRRRSRRRP